MASERRTITDRPGVAYAVASFYDAENRPCAKADAVRIQITEFDAKDGAVRSTTLRKDAPRAPAATAR